MKDFTPKRLVGWLQDELNRFHAERPTSETFTLHDYRRTAFTGLQMAGVSEKECSLLVGATPEVIRRHYEKLDGMRIARRSIERRAASPDAQQLRDFLRTSQNVPLDDTRKSSQTRIS